MKKQLFFLLALIFLFTSADAQNFPTGMKYQAVARDLSGNILANQPISLKITLYSSKKQPTTVNTKSYIEYHHAETNKLGLFTLTIGQGTVAQGDFELIPWSSNEIWMAVAIDPTGGNDFASINESKLLAVPYAIHALTASELAGNQGDSKNGNNGTVWKFGGNESHPNNPFILGTLPEEDLVFITGGETALTIDGVTGKVDIEGDLDVGNDLNVANDVSLNTNGTGSTINNGDFTVANQSATLLTGTLNVNLDTDLDAALNVDGITDLNSNLNVNNGSSTLLTGTLEVDKNATFHEQVLVDNAGLSSSSPATGALVVAGGVGIGENLFVEGNLDVNGTSTFTDLNVENDVHINTNGTGTTIIDGVTTINKATTVNGTMNVNGSGSYIANFKNTTNTNGISIQVANGDPGTDNNFVTFRNSGGATQGRIEGQTGLELLTSFDYLWFTEQEVLNTAFATAMVVADIAGVDDGDAAIIEGAELVDAIANWVVQVVKLNTDVGVTYESGSGDYAEWLEKKSADEVFSYGDIVGVKGGKISKSMANADNYMVVSLSPIVLGNMPSEGKEELSEKVAFMGQVPVKVKGSVQVGDYIIASDSNDGFGIAVNPAKMTLEQYKKIVGVAWSATNNVSGAAMVNVAVGINTNDAVSQMIKQQEEIERMKSSMNGIIGYLKAKDPDFDATEFVVETQPTDQPSEIDMPLELSASKASSKISSLLKSRSDLLTQIMTEAKARLDKKGIDYNLYEQTSRLLNDENYLLEALEEMNR